MHRRNRHLVDNSGVCVCYLTRNSGGTAYTVNYAKKQGVNVFNIAEKSNFESLFCQQKKFFQNMCRNYPVGEWTKNKRFW